MIPIKRQLITIVHNKLLNIIIWPIDENQIGTINSTWPGSNGNEVVHYIYTQNGTTMPETIKCVQTNEE